MGLFDYVIVENADMLPVKEEDRKEVDKVQEFQTKSLDSYLETIRITRSGSIEVKRGSWLNAKEYGEIPNPKWERMLPTGEVKFYGGAFTFYAIFDKGVLQFISGGRDGEEPQTKKFAFPPLDFEYPRVGVAVFIKKDDKYLLMKRASPHGYGTWAIPGGKLDYGETFEECSKREIMEEVGVELKNIKFVVANNNLFADRKHYITIVMKADWAGGEARIMEPEKCFELIWCTLEDIPDPLFLPLETFLKENKGLLKDEKE